jgi:hypothetical protein
MSTIMSPASGGLKLGADKKKVAALVFFLVVAGFLWWRNSQDSDRPPASPAPFSPAPAASAQSSLAHQALPISEPTASPRPSRRGDRNVERNTLEMRQVDPTQGNIDPTLRLELLERLSGVRLGGAGRSLFETGMAPVVSQGKGPIIPVGKEKPVVPPPVNPQPVPPSTPPVQPIPLKFYGFIHPATPAEAKRGFFLDGDIIVVASEGDIIKSRYRVVKLQDHSAVMEDTSNKNQQTLILTPEARGDL